MPPEGALGTTTVVPGARGHRHAVPPGARRPPRPPAEPAGGEVGDQPGQRPAAPRRAPRRTPTAAARRGSCPCRRAGRGRPTAVRSATVAVGALLAEQRHRRAARSTPRGGQRRPVGTASGCRRPDRRRGPPPLASATATSTRVAAQRRQVPEAGRSSGAASAAPAHLGGAAAGRVAHPLAAPAAARSPPPPGGYGVGRGPRARTTSARRRRPLAAEQDARAPRR